MGPRQAHRQRHFSSIVNPKISGFLSLAGRECRAPVGELDCTDFETTLASVSRACSMSSENLVALLKSIATSPDADELPIWERVVLEMCGTRDSVPVPDSVCWFHATRVPIGTRFEEGLLPTSLVQPRIDAELCALAIRLGLCKQKEWSTISRSGPAAHRLRWKRANRPIDDGPHGFLVREVVLHREGLAIPDYFASPEITSEICRSLPKRIGAPLLAAYTGERYPVLVKFRSRLQLKGPMATALNYLHTKLTSDSLSLRCSRGFCGGGIPISREDLIEISFLESP